MVQRGGTVKMNVQNVTLLVCVATLVMVACVLFKTCVNEGFQGGQQGSGKGNHKNSSANENSSLLTGSNAEGSNHQSSGGGGGGNRKGRD